nr:unnamed protein product [Callosobruchus analis]
MEQVPLSLKRHPNSVCVKCGKAYHASCAARDWTANVIKIDKTRCICAEHGITSIDENEETEKIQLLKEIIMGLKERNTLLEENKKLLEEKIDKIEKDASKNKGKQIDTNNTRKASKECMVDTVDTDITEEERASISDMADLRSPEQSNLNSIQTLKVPEEVNPVNPASGVPINPVIHSKNQQDKHNIDNNNIGNSSNPTTSISSINQQNQPRDNLPKGMRDNIVNNDEAEWRKVSYKKNNKNNQYPVNSNRPKPVRGANENSSILKPAQRMSFLFISGLAPDMTSNMVIDYLEEKKLNVNCSCDKMKTKKEKYVSSFRLAVPYCDREKYLDPKLWPTDTLINHFMNLQSHNSRQRTQQI